MALHCVACPTGTIVDAQDTLTDDIDGGAVTVTVAVPDWDVSWVDLAITVAVPDAAGVKTPELLTLPMVDGLTAQVTELLNTPVPVTVWTQVEVWFVRMDAGEQTTVTEVIVDDTVTVTVAEPDLVESCIEVAVIVAVPVAAGVKTPELLTLPMLVGLTDQLTELLKLPVPVTVCVHVEV